MYRLKKYLAFFLALMSVIMLFSSCGASETYRAYTAIETQNADSKYHTNSEKIETVAKNSYIELCIDSENNSICVKDLSTGQIWTSLCKESNGYSYAFSVMLYTPHGFCKLNTQDNCIAFSSSEKTTDDGKLNVRYTLSDKKETAEKSYEEMTDDDIFVIFDVTYELNEQSIYVTIDIENLKCTMNGFVSDIEVLPYFGSEPDREEDWFLIPDNSGALMHLNNNASDTDTVSVNVYGDNPYNPDIQPCASATLPVFGIKRSNSAFCAVITEGDALAQINANRGDKTYNSNVFSRFTITETAEKSENTIKKGVSYNGKLSLVYKFLSGDNATYSAMATVCREELIKSSRLSSAKTDKITNIPFSLTIVGSEKYDALTTTNQTTDILGILKGKGISNIILNYKGLYNGGVGKSNIYSSFISNKLGGSNGLEALYNFAEKQGCTLLLGVNILSSGKNISPTAKAYTITSDKAEYSMRNDLAFNPDTSSGLYTRIGKDAFELGKEKINTSIYSQTASFDMNLMNISAFSNNFRKFLDNKTLDYSDGICVTDAGSVLFSDRNMSRQDAMYEVSSMLRAVSNYGNLAVEGGNLYSLYNASIATNMSFDTFYPENSQYEAIPFAQSVLHGSVLYTGTPIDAGNPLYRYDMLRYIEYGAVPSYEWIYENANVYCYNGYLLSERITETVDFYNDASEMLADLADDRIVSHRKITKDADGKSVSGVYCTEYSDGTQIFVNYTGSIVTTSENIAVGPYDYVKVKR